jgi:hypothetical protein
VVPSFLPQYERFGELDVHVPQDDEQPYDSAW